MPGILSSLFNQNLCHSPTVDASHSQQFYLEITVGTSRVVYDQLHIHYMLLIPSPLCESYPEP